MALYRYNAKDRSGKNVTGVSEVPDEKTLIQILRRQELVILSIKPEKKREALNFGSKFKKKIPIGELVLFARQLATLIESGVPLVQGLEIMSEQAEKKEFKEIMLTVKKDVSTGSGFHEALAKHPNAFNPLFVNMVKAGESSGALDDIMNRLALYLEKTDSLLRKVKSAMIYPSVVTIMALLITVLMLTKVVPVFAGMYADFDAELPGPTQALMNISDFLINYFFYWTGALAGLIFGFLHFIKTPGGRLAWDSFKLKMPLFGPIIRKVAVAKFSRTLSTLIKSGVPILSALDIVGKTAGNMALEKAVDKVKLSIREGQSITEPLSRAKVFPPMVVRMISVGEQTGELEKMLTKIADFYDDQVDSAVAGLTSLIEPLVIAFLGTMIGSIVICMFLPIFNLASVVTNK